MTRTFLLALLLGVGTSALGQHHEHAAHPVPSTPEHEAFLEATRAAIAPYADQNVAIAAGFRPLGPDMPHMGQHWVHPGRAVSRDLSAAEPAMLTYLDVEGRPVLTGAAFTVPVEAGEAPPPFPSPDAWHAHAGRLMDEAFGLVPHGARDADHPRLAMLHAWTESGNPDGVWAADNWGLPFLRRGLAVPHHVPPDAGRAVALVAGYRPFFRRAVGRAADPSPSEWAALDAAFAAGTDAIEAALARDASDVGALARAWQALWADLEARLGASTVEAIRPLFGRHAETGTHAIRASATPPADLPDSP